MHRVPNKVVEIVAKGPQGPVGPLPDGGAYIATASIPNPSLPIIEFEKGDRSTFSLNFTPPASSLPPIVSPSETGSFYVGSDFFGGSLSFIKGNGLVDSYFLNYLTTATLSTNGNYLTFSTSNIQGGGSYSFINLEPLVGNLVPSYSPPPINTSSFLTDVNQPEGYNNYALQFTYGDGSYELHRIPEPFPYTGSAIISGSLDIIGDVSASTYYGDGSNLEGIEGFPYTGSAEISGSLLVDGPLTVNGNFNATAGGHTLNATTNVIQLKKNNNTFVYINDDSYGLRLTPTTQVSIDPGLGMVLGANLFNLATVSNYRGFNIRDGWRLSVTSNPDINYRFQVDGTSKLNGDVIITGSNNLTGTYALKVADSNNNSILAVENDGKVIVSDYLRFAGDGAGGNYLYFDRLSNNLWELGSDGVGRLFLQQGNLTIWNQDFRVGRGGIQVYPSLGYASEAVDIDQTWDSATTDFNTLDITITDTTSSGNSNFIRVTKDNFTGFTLSENFDITTTGSVSASTYYGDGSNLEGIEGFPYTGSAEISGSLTVIGSSTLGSTTLTSINGVDVEVISKDINFTSSINIAQLTSSIESAMIDYRLTSLNSGSRIGTFMYSHDGTDLSYNDLSVPGSGTGGLPILSASLAGSLVNLDIENAAGFNFTGFVRKFDKLDFPVPVANPNLPTPLLDAYGGAAAAYSLRKLSVAYTGSAVRVREDGGNTEADIGFDVNGGFDISALNAHCGANNGFVTIWYDQSGNSNDATQTTAGNQPKIYDSSTGVILSTNSPGITWNPSEINYLQIPNSVFNSGRYWAFQILDEAGGSSNLTFMGSSEGNNWTLLSTPSGNPLNGGSTLYDLIIDSTNIITGSSQQNLYQYLNDDEIHLMYHSQDLRSDVDYLFGYNTQFGLKSQSTQKELIIYPSDQSSNREGIETNINNHYNIYDTGLIAQYSGATAAYSLRQLTTGYTGSAVRVREDGTNSETDIGFDSDGNLDILALAEHCAGNNGFVTTWYDQSGEGNDAAQVTTTSQPKIYDASNGVNVENNKPCLYFNGVNSKLSIGTTIEANPSNYTFSFVYKAYNTSVGEAMFWTFAGPLLIEAGQTNGGRVFYDGAQRGANVQNLNQMQRTYILDSNGSEMYNNGVLFDTDDYTQRAISDSTAFGTYPTNLNNAAEMDLQEFVIWNSNKSTNRTGIETNINDHFQIYDQNPTGLLADYPGAAAAYSLRQLISTAQYAVAVRRDSDDAVLPIGFVNGELDTTTLASFCGNSNGFVSVWYDQSGEGNHATQATTSAQPKIYDSSTGVILDEDNNLPAALFAGDYLNSGTVSATGIATNFAVGNISGGFTTRVLFFTPECFAYFTSTDWRVFSSSTSTAYAGNEQGLNLHYFGADNAGSFGAINGGTLTTSANAADANTKISIGTQSTNVAPFYGYVQECIYYNSDESTNRTAIETNINNFYSIYA